MPPAADNAAAVPAATVRASLMSTWAILIRAEAQSLA